MPVVNEPGSTAEETVPDTLNPPLKKVPDTFSSPEFP